MTKQTVPGRSGGTTASLYRLATSDHLCPYGLKTKSFLERRGFSVEDHPLTTREEADRFMQEHDVKTTPQVFIGGERIGGYDDTRKHFGKRLRGKDETTYQPVIALFTVALLMGFAVSWFASGSVFSINTIEASIAIAMCLLGVQKLQNIESFSTMFLNYDLLARRYVSYAYFYAFGETLAGVLMLAGALMWIASPLALFIGTVGAVSVFKAVYIDKRKLKCACVGGNSNVPLGFVSLTENLIMIAMAIWMPLRMGWM